MEAPVATCNKACSFCCHITAEEISAKNDADMRRDALRLSGLIAVMLVAAHIYYAPMHVDLQINELEFIVAVAPWVGAGLAKLINVSGFKLKGIGKKPK